MIRAEPIGSPLAVMVGTVQLFSTVKDDLLARFWLDISWERRVELVTKFKRRVSDQMIRAIDGLAGGRQDEIIFFRLWIEERSGHYSIETAEEWGEVSRCLPAMRELASLWSLAERHFSSVMPGWNQIDETPLRWDWTCPKCGEHKLSSISSSIRFCAKCGEPA